MTLLSTFTNIVLHIKQKTDVKNIVIYSQENNTEVFKKVQYIDGSIQDDIKIMEHPKEDGTVIADHAIDDPKTAKVTLIIDDEDSQSLNEILDYYKKRTPLVVKIKNEIYSNFIIASKPLSADSSHYDKTIYELSFKEVINAVTTYVKMNVPNAQSQSAGGTQTVKNKKDASTIKTGHKQGTTTSTPKPSILRIWTNKIMKK